MTVAEVAATAMSLKSQEDSVEDAKKICYVGDRVRAPPCLRVGRDKSGTYAVEASFGNFFTKEV